MVTYWTTFRRLHVNGAASMKREVVHPCGYLYGRTQCSAMAYVVTTVLQVRHDARLPPVPSRPRSCHPGSGNNKTCLAFKTFCSYLKLTHRVLAHFLFRRWCGAPPGPLSNGGLPHISLRAPVSKGLAEVGKVDIVLTFPTTNSYISPNWKAVQGSP